MRDEEFHHSITELLADWAETSRPIYEAVQIIGERWSPRSVELRDQMNRNGVPAGFYDTDTDEGRELLAAHGVGVATAQLPVVILQFRPDLPPLQNPPDDELGDAFGVNVTLDSGTNEPIASATTMRVAHQTLHHDPRHPSAIILPVRNTRPRPRGDAHSGTGD